MQVVDRPDQILDVHREVLTLANRAEPETVTMSSPEHHALYVAARKAFAVVQTTEARPYACFLLRKGVIFD